MQVQSSAAVAIFNEKKKSVEKGDYLGKNIWAMLFLKGGFMHLQETFGCLLISATQGLL